MSESSSSPSLAKRALAVAVGLFAVWQLVYLPLANLVAFVPLRPEPPLEPLPHSYRTEGTFTDCEPLQRGAETSGRALERWAEASGQEQGWSLFAPGPPPFSVFAATEFRWADGASESVLSRFEPRDYSNPPVRAPVIHDREFNFEMQFVFPVWYAAPKLTAEHPERWAHLPSAVRSLRREILAWLDWRLRDYLAASPHRERPREVILKHRYIDTPHPGSPASETRTVTERPFARWFPETGVLEAFDVVTATFVPVEVTP